MKQTWSQKSCDTLPLILVLLLVLRAQQFPHAWRLLPRKVNLFYSFLLLSFRKKKVPFFCLYKENKVSRFFWQMTKRLSFFQCTFQCQDFVGKWQTRHAFLQLYILSLATTFSLLFNEGFYFISIYFWKKIRCKKVSWNSLSSSVLDWIRIFIWIIRSGSGSRKGKRPKNRTKLRIFMFWRAVYSHRGAGSFPCSLKTLHGSITYSFFEEKKFG